MNGALRVSRILRALASEGADKSGPAALCRVGSEQLQVNGTGLLLRDHAERTSVDGGDPTMARLHRLQMDLGEGPSVDAHHGRSPVLAPDLSRDSRWPGFAPAAIAAGACAVFSAPARVGEVRLGAFSAWRDRPGPLTDDQHADLLVLGEIAARVLLDSLFGAAPPGQIDDHALEFDSVVHQAVGMLTVQLRVSLCDAMLRLQAHAFSEGLEVTQVAAAIVGRRLQLPRDA